MRGVENNSPENSIWSTGKLESRGRLRWTEVEWVNQLRHPGLDWRWGCPPRCQHKSVWQWAEACACVHDRVSVWMSECVWVCLPVPGVRAQCPAVSLCPPSLLLVNLCPNPAAPRIHPTQQPIFSFFFFFFFLLWLTCSFMRAFSFRFLPPLSFSICLWVSLKFFKCGESVLVQPLVYCPDRENVVHSSFPFGFVSK